jgi:hypothetical protein
VLSFWDFFIVTLLGVIGFFIPFAPHVPHSRGARAAFILIPVLLFALDRYLWATTGRDLIDRGTCLIVPSSYSCRPAPPERAPPDVPEIQAQERRHAASPAAPREPAPVIPPARSPPPAATPATEPAPGPPAPAPKADVQTVVLDDRNAKDIWSTSVYSYAPGGGGPGGGLANDRLRVGGWGDEYVSLIRFDLPDVPCTSKVVLQLYNSNDSPSPTPANLEIITSSWSYGDRLWWRDLPSMIPSDIGVLPAPSPNAWMSIDISRIFERWCRRTLPNYGLMLRPLLNNNNYDAFYSTRGAELFRPRLVISN